MDTESRPTYKDRYALTGVLLLALAVRLVRLGSRDYWHDEVHDLLKAQNLKDVILHGEMVSNHPPLFSVLVWLWQFIGLDYNEWTMRMLPMLLGVGGVAAIYWLGKILFDRRIALASAFLLAISPFHLLHSQDLKVYILLPLTGTIAVAFLYLAFERNHPRLWAAYGFFAAIACYSDLFAGPMLVAVNLWFLLLLRGRTDRLVPWALANIGGALLFLPQLGVMLEKAQNIMIEPTNWWVPPPSILGAMFYFKTIAFGYSHSDPLFKFAMVLFAVLAVWGAVYAAKVNPKAAVLLVFWFGLSTVILYVISLYTQSIFLIRAMLPYAIPVYLLVALGWMAIPRRPARFVCAAALAAIAAVPCYHRYADFYSPENFPHRPGIHPPRDYQAVTEHILDQWQEGDVVIHAAAATWLPGYWYGLKGRPSYVAALKQGFIDHINQGNPRNTADVEFDGYFPARIESLVPDARRIWFLFSEWERIYLRQEDVNPGNATELWRWIDAHAQQTARKDFLGIELYLYEYNQGDPPRVLRRDNDDGVLADLTIEGREQNPYSYRVPDNYLVATPPESRRGAITLRFGGGVGDADGPWRTLPVVLENRTENEVRYALDVLGSNALVHAASLYQPDPQKEAWQITGYYRTGHPRLENNILIVQSAFRIPGAYSLRGTVDLDAGLHVPVAYQKVYPRLSSEMTPPPIEITFDDKVTAVSAGDGRLSMPGWQWVLGSPVVLPPADQPRSLTVTAQSNNVHSFSPVEIVYLAFLPLNRANHHAQQEHLDLPPGVVVVPPNATIEQDVTVDANAARVDVWAFKLDVPGEVHHIFEIVTP